MDYSQVALLLRSSIANINRCVGSKSNIHRIGLCQVEYLLQISMNPGINQLELARRRNAGKPGATKALRILEKNNLICRESDPEDLRNRRCYLTEHGEVVASEFHALAGRIGRMLFSDFSLTESKQFVDYLRRFCDASRRLEDRMVNIDPVNQRSEQKAKR